MTCRETEKLDREEMFVALVLTVLGCGLAFTAGTIGIWSALDTAKPAALNQEHDGLGISEVSDG